MNQTSKYKVPVAILGVIIIALIVVIVCAHANIFRGVGPGGVPAGNPSHVSTTNSDAAMIGGSAMTPMFSYHDDQRGYGFSFPMSLAITNKTAQYPERKMTAVFPDSFFNVKPSTLDKAEVYARVTAYSCDKIDELNSYPASTKNGVLPAIKTKDGIVLDFNEFGDAGAGNSYGTYEYSTTIKGECVRIGIADHQANPGIVYEDRDQAKTAGDNNMVITNNLLAILYKIAGTFALDPTSK